MYNAWIYVECEYGQHRCNHFADASQFYGGDVYLANCLFEKIGGPCINVNLFDEEYGGISETGFVVGLRE